MRQFYVRRSIREEDLCISVDAGKIRYETKTLAVQKKRLRLLNFSYCPEPLLGFINKVIYETSRFTIDESEIERVAIDQTPIYLKMKDVFENRENLTSSQTYDDIARNIADNGFFKHKKFVIRTIDEIEDFIRQCYLDIMVSMDEFGYLDDKKSEFATSGLGSAFVDRDGKILKAMGASHRFAAAQIVGLNDPFPFRVLGVHSDWLQSLGIGAFDMASLARQIQLAGLDNRR